MAMKSQIMINLFTPPSAKSLIIRYAAKTREAKKHVFFDVLALTDAASN